MNFLFVCILLSILLSNTIQKRRICLCPTGWLRPPSHASPVGKMGGLTLPIFLI